MNQAPEIQEKTVTITEHGFRRLDYVDGLRAIGALWVAVGHYAMDPGGLMHPTVKKLWLHILALHGIPVMVFLVLSGFCLYYPMVAKSSGASVAPPRYDSFMIRRARRIMPPFYGAVFLCTVLILWVPFMRDLNPQPLTGWAILHHLALIHNLIEASAHAVDYPVWSIGLEWQLYLLFPALVWMIWRWGMKATFIITVLAAIVARAVFKIMPGDVTFALVSGPLPYCCIMLIGMYAAHITAIRPCRAPNWVLWVGFVTFAGLTIIGLGGAFGSTFACGIATFFVLLLALNEQGFVHRALSAHWLSKVGLFSYSIYLLHAPILHAMRYSLNHSGFNVETKFLIFMLVVMPAMLACSYGFFLVFERPFIGKTRKLSNASPPTAAPIMSTNT